MSKSMLKLLAFAAALAQPTAARAQQDAPAAQEEGSQERAAPVVRTIAWPASVLDAVAKTPIQAEGRIKPLSTYADFKLLGMSGRRSLHWETKNGGDVEKRSRTSVEWLLDSLFFPEQAVWQPCFLLDTYEVADAIGVARGDKGKRDRWSYMDLLPGRDTLIKKYRALMKDESKHDAKNRTVIEEQLLQLERKIGEYEELLYALEFARHSFPLGDDAKLRALFGGADQASFATVMDKADELARERQRLRQPGSEGDPADASEKRAIEALIATVTEACQVSGALHFIPPADPPKTLSRESMWLTVADVVAGWFGGDERLAPQMDVVAALAQAYEGRDSTPVISAALTRVHDRSVELATRLGEYRKLTSEVVFYRFDLFYYALILYVFGFIGVAIGWMVRADHPLHKWLPRYMALPLAIHVAGIAWRCYLRGRPPVSTLYETILFISGIAVFVALVIEWINRRRVALGFAAAIGAFGLFFASSYEAKEAFDKGVDTMPQLQAVLDTNFWLSTHVTTVTIGYSAGLLAAFLAHIFVLGRLFGFKKGDGDFYRNVVRMVYGVLCFGLLFSVVGTILGGVWANDSWGRFWGWDPKENGALMICLCELAILHGRMGGYLRELGLAAAAVFNGVIVAFSWWHVNLLGVGLHAYGFTNGILGRLWIFYGVEALVLFAALYLWLDRRAAMKAASLEARALPKPLPHGGA